MRQQHLEKPQETYLADDATTFFWSITPIECSIFFAQSKNANIVNQMKLSLLLHIGLPVIDQCNFRFLDNWGRHRV